MLPAFPSRALELRTVIFRLRIAEAEISYEAPCIRDFQYPADMGRVENRDPAHSNALRACRKPHRADGRDDRVFGHLRHGPAPEAMAGGGCRIGEHRQLRGGLADAGELELDIAGGQIAGI